MSELAPGVHVLGGKKGGRVRAFLLDAGNELTLIDSLFDGDARDVLAYLARIGRRVTDVRRIVLTHAHRSHLGGVAALKRLSGAAVYAHEWEADIVSGERRAQPVTLRPVQSLRLWPFQAGLALGRPKHPPSEVDHGLADGDAIGPVQALHLPGHTPGHFGFYWPERRFLVAGDAVATWPELCPGWKAFNLNVEQQRESLGRMAALDVDIVGVGHGDPITRDARERLASLVV